MSKRQNRITRRRASPRQRKKPQKAPIETDAGRSFVITKRAEPDPGFPFLESSTKDPAPQTRDPEILLGLIAGRLRARIARATSESEKRDLIRERGKVVNWLVSDRGGDLDARTLYFFRSFGLSVSKIEAIRTEMEERPRGRPVTQKHAAIKALREQLQNPEKTRAEIATTVCRCSRSSHGSQCVAALWAEVKRLKRFLRKYGYRL